MEGIPSFDELMRIAPITSIVLLCVGAGFGAAWFLSKQHIQTLKDFIEFLKKG